MIDFNNSAFFKLKKVANNTMAGAISGILVSDENIIGTYKGIRDYVVFTDKRVISVNVQGLTGKKQDFTSMPYSKISVFSVETAGTLDLDSELEMYFSGVGKVKFEFSGSCDIAEIGRIIGNFVL